MCVGCISLISKILRKHAVSSLVCPESEHKHVRSYQLIVNNIKCVNL